MGIKTLIVLLLFIYSSISFLLTGLGYLKETVVVKFLYLSAFGISLFCGMIIGITLFVNTVNVSLKKWIIVAIGLFTLPLFGFLLVLIGVPLSAGIGDFTRRIIGNESISRIIGVISLPFVLTIGNCLLTYISVYIAERIYAFLK